jgi:hypothetical protein
MHFNVIQSKKTFIVIGLKFIEDFIFLTKKNFLTKFQKLASERNFDVEQKKIFLGRKKILIHFFLFIFIF